ncbi:MAG: hypothetical protein ACOYOO_04220, partial [Saprospiraceae bacterium]
SEEYSAAAGGKRLFTQPQIKSFAAKPRIPLVNSYDKRYPILLRKASGFDKFQNIKSKIVL